MNAKFCLFMSRCSVFFFHFGTFLREKSETNTFYWKHHLKSSGQELKRKSSLARFKVTRIIFSLYVWLLTCREPNRPLFWLEQELHVEGEQVKYVNWIQFSFVTFRSNARSHNRHPFHDHTDGRWVAELSRDSKYSNEKGSEQLTTKFQTIHSLQVLVDKHNRNRRTADGFTIQTRTCWDINRQLHFEHTHMLVKKSTTILMIILISLWAFCFLWQVPFRNSVKWSYLRDSSSRLGL